MQVRRLDDPAGFLEEAAPLLLEDEARNQLVLGIGGTLVDHPEVYPGYGLWLASDGNGPAAAALRTPPYNVLFSDARSDAALDALVQTVKAEEPDAPGLVANTPFAERAVEAWGRPAERVMTQGVFALKELREVAIASGSARPCSEGDRNWLVPWLLDFATEALPDGEKDATRLERMLDVRLGSDPDAGIWVWEDAGKSVSIAGHGGRTPSGMRIGPVFTPKELRGRGYATSLVAQLSKWILSGGRRWCFLYTDLANPTSNSIYERIGYEKVCESAEYHFA